MARIILSRVPLTQSKQYQLFSRLNLRAAQMFLIPLPDHLFQLRITLILHGYTIGYQPAALWLLDWLDHQPPLLLFQLTNRLETKIPFCKPFIHQHHRVFANRIDSLPFILPYLLAHIPSRHKIL